MMKNLADFDRFQEILPPAQSILLVLGQKASFDQVASALSLYLSFTKAGKQVFLASSEPMTVGFSSLVGVDKVGQKIKGKNLVVSFDYFEDSIEKVSYHIKDNKFNLVIQPKEGFPSLAAEKINFSHSGTAADLILTVGVSSLVDLGEVYLANKALFTIEKTVNFNLYLPEVPFAKINLVDEKAASYSEITTFLLAKLKLPFDADIANNLLQGIKTASHSFTVPKVRAETFEAAATCLRLGATWAAAEAKKEVVPSPDWMEPKIYKSNTLA